MTPNPSKLVQPYSTNTREANTAKVIFTHLICRKEISNTSICWLSKSFSLILMNMKLYDSFHVFSNYMSELVASTNLRWVGHMLQMCCNLYKRKTRLQIWWLGFLCLCMVLVLIGSWLFAPTFLLRLTTHETTSHMVSNTSCPSLQAVAFWT